MDKSLEKLQKLCELNNISLTFEKLKLFDIYLKMYLKWNKVHNLSSIRKKEEVVIKHFFDSLTLVKLFEEKDIDIKNKEIADLGTGGGFPGVPLKIYYGNKIKLYLIEAVQKKCIFLEMLRRELNLEYEVLCNRSENINNKFDIVVSRATGETFDVLKWGKDILKTSGYLIIMKAKKVEEELKPFTVSLNFKNYPERKFIVIQKK
ncbi:MAG: 16S rRNA (guanine(527)-N(7))-methyltransferase RsmG [Hydrogenothermus sp.]|nr:MAG: 16S rRNA (guanine(527)-N(7))-methyltransferase RsmG [Hydrogenothermus sp.]